MKCLLLIDIQNDFLPGGALAVPEGDQILPLVNRLQKRFDIVVASKDWHPAGHSSFASSHPAGSGVRTRKALGQQILWPDHCVQGSLGAEFPQELESEGISHTVFKGTDPAIDSYSAFFDNARQHKTDLDEYLRSKAVTELYVAGLATDYCVFFTVMDALSLGYKTYVLVDAVRGVELKEGDCERALKKMNEAGAALLKEGEALPPFLQTSHPS